MSSLDVRNLVNSNPKTSTTGANDISSLRADVRPDASGGGALTPKQPAVATPDENNKGWTRVLKRLRVTLGEEIYSSWFAQAELEGVEAGVAYVSQPTRFLQNWTKNHYLQQLTDVCTDELTAVERVNVCQRQPGMASPVAPAAHAVTMARSGAAANQNNDLETAAAALETSLKDARTEVNGFEGSPLDMRLTFETFVQGQSNRLAHAAARQVVDTLFDRPLKYNPLYLHANVGLGKTHLLHAIAWDVKRRYPQARVLYLTAERFRYRFVEALKSQKAMSFNESLRSIDILLIDDMEFLQGERTEEEFLHTLNALLDSGKQVVVASAVAPNQLESLDPRMKSRLGGGLVAELSSLDYDLRRRIVERRIEEKRAKEPSFTLSDDVTNFLAEKLVDSARDLDGAVTRLYATGHLTGDAITVESVEHIIRDLMKGQEPKRIKIEDILRLVSKHYSVSRNDLLSQRRQRSIVLPRQVAMYLAKQLTSRSLPEIGRRIGNRDHTTVLHAVRKIDEKVGTDQQLKSEIEELKRFLCS